MTQAKNDWLWDRLHDLFDTDDGSLPEIHVHYPRPADVPLGFAYLASVAMPLPTTATYWSIEQQRDVLIEDARQAAELVVANRAQAIHVVFRGIRRAGGPEIPALGCFVFSDLLALDYRPGPSWGASQVAELFSLLSALVDLSGGASPSLWDGAVPDDRRRFDRAWIRFRDAGAG